MRWPWTEYHEAERVAAEEPIPRWTHWRKPPRKLEPEPCKACGTDARTTHVLVEGKMYCLPCGIREVR